MKKFKSFSRFLSMTVMLAFVINFISPSFMSYADAGNNFKTTYVEGVEFQYKIDLDGITVITTDGSVELKLDYNGNGLASVTEKGVEKEYILKINDLDISKNKVDVRITDNLDGGMVKFNSFQDIVGKEYVGQAAVAVPIIGVGGIVLGILLIAGLVVIIGGILYVAITEIAQELGKKARGQFFPAVLDNNAPFIDPNGITKQQAAIRIQSGLSIYTFLKSDAYAAVQATGMGVSAAEFHGNNKSSGIWACHYHTYSHGVAHAWYGLGYAANGGFLTNP